MNAEEVDATVASLVTVADHLAGIMYHHPKASYLRLTRREAQQIVAAAAALEAGRLSDPVASPQVTAPRAGDELGDWCADCGEVCDPSDGDDDPLCERCVEARDEAAIDYAVTVAERRAEGLDR